MAIFDCTTALMNGCKIRAHAAGLLSIPAHDIDTPDEPFRFRPHEIDREQAVRQIGPQHLHAVGQQERPLELARGDAAMQELPVFVVALPATNAELVFFQRDLELVSRDPATARVILKRSGSSCVLTSRSML